MLYYELTIENLSQSILTITYRALPPPAGDVLANFSNECVVSARNALESHQIAATRFRESDEMWQIYTNW
jgi:hypothetical protein